MPYRAILRLAAFLLLAAVAFGCAAGGNSDLVPSDLSLSAAIEEVRNTAAPSGVEPATWAELQAELIRVLTNRGVSKLASAPPVGGMNTVKDLKLVQEGGKWFLQWSYVNIGDNDQNSEVNIADLTPIGLYFQARAGMTIWDAAQIADPDGNGEVNIADITPIGQNYFSSVAGYELFGSTDPSDHPANNGGVNGPGTTSLGFVDFDAATKTGASMKSASESSQRLRFSVEVMPSSQQPLYWVRPVQSQGGEQGEASVPTGGDPQVAPVLTLTNPPAGSGTPADPYEPDVQVPYYFKLTDAGGNDVTASPDAQIIVSDVYAGKVVGGLLDIPDTYSGDFVCSAIYNGHPVAPGTELYCHVEKSYIPSDLQLTAWVPEWLTGSGTASDPYTNPGLYHPGDSQTDFVVTDPVDGDVSFQATYYVDPPVAEVHMDWADNLVLQEDALTWGQFYVTAEYKGKQARVYFDLTRALQLTLTNPPPQGDGTQANPYIGDISTAYNVLLTEVTDGNVTGGTDSWENGWTNYTIGELYEAPEDMGWLYGNWLTKDTATNTAVTGFQDSFLGGPTRPCWIEGKYSVTRTDGQGNPYDENAYSNRIYMILQPPGLLAPDGFVMYRDAATAEPIEFYETMWLNANEAYGTVYDGGQWENWCEVYHTTDSGATWTLVRRVEGRNTGIGAGMWLNMWPDQMWYSTYFSGFGISGSAGFSLDDGLNWTDAEGPIQVSWDEDPDDGIVYSYPIGRFTRTNYGIAGDRMWVVGGEYRPWVSYTDDVAGPPHLWTPAPVIGAGTDLAWIEIAGVGSELLLYGQDTASDRHYLRFNPGSGMFDPWEAAFPVDFNRNDCFWTHGAVSSGLTLISNSSAPRYILTTMDGGRTLNTVLHMPADPGPQDVSPATALALSDGTMYMTGYKSEGAMVGGYVGHQQVLQGNTTSGDWQLLMSQYAGWSGVGSYEIGLLQDYSGSVHLTRRWQGYEYGHYPLP